MKGAVEQKKYRKNGAEAKEIVVQRKPGWQQGTKPTFLIIAPHAGSIEVNTYRQAREFHEQVAELGGATTWIFGGEKGDQSAFDTWHVPSTKISGRKPQFDLLEEHVEGRSYYQGVSFHGYSKDGILIGGQHRVEWKELIADGLRRALPVNIPVEIATRSGEYAGLSDSNIINRLSDSAIQVEQSKRVRKRYWDTVVDVLATLYSESS